MSLLSPTTGAVRREFKAGWRVVLACTVGFALGSSGLTFYTSGVFLDALKTEFHWSVAALQSGIVVVGLLAFILTPTVGYLIDRFGSRRVVIPSMIAFGLCFMALSRQDGTYRTFFILWTLLAISGAGTLSLVWSRAVSGWFDAGRGLALGVTLLGTGVTAVVAPPLAAWLIKLGGWRFAYVMLGAGSLCLSAPLLLFLLHDRESARRTTVDVPGRSLGQALRDWRFWMIGACLLCATLTVAGIIPNLVKLLTSHGFSRVQAASTVSFIGVFVILGRLSCGFLMDRFHAPWVGAAFFAGLPVACLLLASPSLGVPGAVTAAALVGLGAAAEFDVIPFLVCRYFGLRRLGMVLGAVMLFFNLGSATAPIAFGRVFDVYGGYASILYVMAGVSTLGALSLLTLGRYPDLTAAARREPQAAGAEALAAGGR